MYPDTCAALITCLDLQDFEKKEHKLKARAATNLAFLYSLEGDSANAERYADLALGTDKYSAQALVNKVSCVVVKKNSCLINTICLDVVQAHCSCEAILRCCF